MLSKTALSFLVALTAASPVKRGLPRLGGVNIAGWDFDVEPPIGQISHFQSEGANIFRFPIAWEYLINSSTDPTAPFDQDVFSQYDQLVTTATNGGSYAIVDIHNYARFPNQNNSGIIGQGGPSDQDFANLWSQLASHYAGNDLVLFGIMNEPHDLDVPTWANTVQAAVNAIRAAGATSQTCIIPGTGYTGIGEYLDGDDDPLLSVYDPAHSGDNSYLIFDIHHYLDSDGSGSTPDCVNNGISGNLDSMVSWLQSHGRQGILTETGGGQGSDCATNLGQELAYVVQNQATIVGFTTWAAGAFSTTYTLSETPNADGSDQPVWVNAVQPNLP